MDLAHADADLLNFEPLDQISKSAPIEIVHGEFMQFQEELSLGALHNKFSPPVSEPNEILPDISIAEYP